MAQGVDQRATPAAVWKTLLIVVGVAAVGLGVALNESGVPAGRTIVLVGLPLALVGMVLAIAGRERRPPPPAPDLGEQLAAVAQQIGLTLRGDTAWGRVKDRDIEISIVADEPSPIRIRALCKRELDMGLSVARGRPAGDARQEVHTSDMSFNASYTVRVDEPPRALAILTERLRQQMIAADAQLDDRGVTVLAADTRPDTIADGIRRARKLANELERATGKVPCATTLAAARSAWHTFADSHSLASADCPLSMWGRIGQVNVAATAVRDAFKQYHFEITADFPEPLKAGLSLKPASHHTQFDRSGEPVGHPAFDKVFSVKATDPADAARLMGPETRKAILALRDTGVQVRASDEGMWGWIGFREDEPEQVARGLAKMAKIAGRILANAKRFSEKPPPR